MIKIAVYGKGGIGKSTTVSNIAAVFASEGLRVMQIGCDPKADSTVLLRHGEKVETVLDLVRTKKDNFTLEDIVKEGFAGVCCVEAGGPSPDWLCRKRNYCGVRNIRKKGSLREILSGCGNLRCSWRCCLWRIFHADASWICR